MTKKGLAPKCGTSTFFYLVYNTIIAQKKQIFKNKAITQNMITIKKRH